MANAEMPDAGYDFSAFEIADSQLRRALVPNAQQFVARALAFLKLGFLPDASVDFRRAFRLGSADPYVVEAVMTYHDDEKLRRAAAQVAILSSLVSDRVRDIAAHTLLTSDVDPVIHARRSGSKLSGWIASRVPVPPRLWSISMQGRRVDIGMDVASSLDCLPHADRWCFVAQADPSEHVTLRAVSAAGTATSLTMSALNVSCLPHRQMPADLSPSPDTGLTIVIPVYGDPDSLAACLDSVARQDDPDLSVVLVDDASPHREVSRMALAFCQSRRRLYVRNATNRGFAASVNVVLARRQRTDVLLLNSDVVLPDGALVRLRRAAYSAPDIGIVSPLSNDAGNASFPDPAAPRPALSSALALRVDNAAARVNQGSAIDVPAVHGSCLFLRRDCLNQVGMLSPVYGRGYYEDTDLCLRAREKGYRVVVACDVYVSHQSGRSFGSDRYALITRNMAVLDRRFPDHAADDAAHDRADPLRRVRATLEAADPILQVSTVVVVGRAVTRGALLRERHRVAERGGAVALTLDWSIAQDGSSCSLVSSAGPGPRAAAFALDAAGLSGLTAFLARSSVERIEICEIDAVPPLLLGWLSACEVAPVRVVVDSASTAAMARQFDSPPRPSHFPQKPVVIVTDAMAQAAMAEPERPRSETGLAWSGAPSQAVTGTAAMVLAAPSTRHQKPRQGSLDAGREDNASASGKTGPCPPARMIRLGVLLPQPWFEADRLILAMSRRLHRERIARLVVLGDSAIATRLTTVGTCSVSGPMDVVEFPAALRHYGIDRLWSPYRTSHHWVLEAMRGQSLPAAFFDWSSSGQPALKGDLLLDPIDPDTEICSRLMTWLAVLTRCEAR